MAAFALENNWTKGAIMHPIADGTAFNVELSQNFERAFTDSDGEIVITETYHLTDADFQGQLTAIKNSGSQAIFLSSYVNGGAKIPSGCSREAGQHWDVMPSSISNTLSDIEY